MTVASWGGGWQALVLGLRLVRAVDVDALAYKSRTWLHDPLVEYLRRCDGGWSGERR
jgi:hypothetical protein